MLIDPAALVLVLVIAGGIGAALSGAAYALRFINHRIDELEAVLAKRRHTCPTAAGLEDGMAVVIDVLHEEQRQSMWRQSRFEEARRILGEIREGPLAYDAEQPARRPRRPGGGSGA